jgi:hypothetical protein
MDDLSLPVRLKDEKGVVLIEIVNGEYRIEILDSQIEGDKSALDESEESHGA